MFAFLRLLIYICLPPLWLQTLDPCSAAGRQRALPGRRVTPLNATHAQHRPTRRPHTRALQSTFPPPSCSSVLSARGRRSEGGAAFERLGVFTHHLWRMFALCQPLSPNCYLIVISFSPSPFLPSNSFFFSGYYSHPFILVFALDLHCVLSSVGQLSIIKKGGWVHVAPLEDGRTVTRSL